MNASHPILGYTVLKDWRHPIYHYLECFSYRKSVEYLVKRGAFPFKNRRKRRPTNARCSFGLKPGHHARKQNYYLIALRAHYCGIEPEYEPRHSHFVEHKIGELVNPDTTPSMARFGMDFRRLKCCRIHAAKHEQEFWTENLKRVYCKLRILETSRSDFAFTQQDLRSFLLRKFFVLVLETSLEADRELRQTGFVHCHF